MGWHIALLMFLGGIGGGLVFPILPLLGVQLGLSGALIGLILSMNRITRLAANPVAGALVDRLGGKWPLTFGLLLETVATLSFSVAIHSAYPGLWFLCGRAAWGAGSAALFVGGLTAAINSSSPENRGHITALVRTAMSLGLPAGLVVGGIISGVWSDNAAFLTAAALTLVAALLAVTLIPQTKPNPAGRGGGRGAAGKSPGLSGLLSNLRWVDGRVVIIWVYNFLSFFTLQGTLLTTLVVFVQDRHISLFGANAQAASGLLMAVMMGISAVTSLIVGRLVDRWPFRTTTVIPSALLVIVGFAILAFAHGTASALVALVLLGGGMGGTSIPLLALLGDIAPEEYRGRAMGLYQVVGDAGGSLGPIIGMDIALRYGFVPTYLLSAAVVAVAVPFAITLLRAEQRPKLAAEAS